MTSEDATCTEIISDDVTGADVTGVETKLTLTAPNPSYEVCAEEDGVEESVNGASRADAQLDESMGSKVTEGGVSVEAGLHLVEVAEADVEKVTVLSADDFKIEYHEASVTVADGPEIQDSETFSAVADDLEIKHEGTPVTVEEGIGGSQRKETDTKESGVDPICEEAENRGESVVNPIGEETGEGSQTQGEDSLAKTSELTSNTERLHGYDNSGGSMATVSNECDDDLMPVTDASCEAIVEEPITLSDAAALQMFGVREKNTSTKSENLQSELLAEPLDHTEGHDEFVRYDIKGQFSHEQCHSKVK